MRTHVGAEMPDSNVNDKKNIERDSARIRSTMSYLPRRWTRTRVRMRTDVRPVPRHHQSPHAAPPSFTHASLIHTSTRLNITRVYTTRQQCKSTRQHSRAELPTPKPLIRGQLTAIQNKCVNTSRSGQLSIDLESMVFCSTAWNQQPADTARPTSIGDPSPQPASKKSKYGQIASLTAKTFPATRPTSRRRPRPVRD